uniref:Alpha 1,3-galactosyltransferase 2 n=1 Tax=Hucho hucho TaxID=62062 RepID=A0A4W5QC71_9TELE
MARVFDVLDDLFGLPKHYVLAGLSVPTRSRGDVQTCTDWGSPVIWDGMFDPDHYDQEHRRNHSSVSLTVFAVGRYLDAYLEALLLSAERHFMVALPVTYYVFTDVPERVPDIQLGPERSLKVVRVQRHSRWQDISMMHMRAIADAIESQIRQYSRYVFCFDVDQVFVGRFGSEALGDSVALSRAYMETGDFYCHAAVFGGSWQTVKNMTETCYQTIMEDKENQMEALWHDESHLNKYLWLHKPSRVLSPEYCWSSDIGYRGDMHVTRLLWAKKNYDTLRVTV